MKKMHFLLLFFYSALLNAQTEDANWLLGYGGGTDDLMFGITELRFRPFGKVDTFNNQSILMNFYRSSNSISDSSRQLLFYYAYENVEDSTFHLMENGDTLETNMWLIPPIPLTITKPGSPSQYYIFHSGIAWDVLNSIHTRSLNYSIVDMDENNGLGKVVKKRIPIVIDTLMYGKPAATRHANGRDWWVITNKKDSNLFYKILVTPWGMQVDTQTVGQLRRDGLGQSCFSPDGTKLAFGDGIDSQYKDFWTLYDFDRETGELSSQLSMHILTYEEGGGSGGCAFSPNSRFFYQIGNLRIFQYDLWAADFLGSKTLVAELDDFQSPWRGGFFLSELAPDGKIYINTTSGSNILHVIEFPNKKGLACQVTQHGVRLPTNNTGLPNFPNYRLGPLDGSVSDSLGLNNEPVADWSYSGDSLAQNKIYFTDLSYYEPTDWHWNFGDGSVSMEQEPTHTYTLAGDYLVCQVASNQYSSDTACQVITVKSGPMVLPTAHILVDSATSGCRPLVVSLHADTSHATSILWKTGSIPKWLDVEHIVITYYSSEKATVQLNAYNEYGNVFDQQVIDIYEPPNIHFFNVDYPGYGKAIECSFGATVGNGEVGSYIWDFGDGKVETDNAVISHTYDTPGTYVVSLTITNQCGTAIELDTVDISPSSFNLPFGQIYSNTLFGCSPLYVTFWADTAFATNILWTFDGGVPSTSTLDTVTVVFDSWTGGDVSLVVSNLDTSVILESGVSVRESAIADFDFSMDGLELHLSNNSLAAIDYYWDFGDGFYEASTLNPIHLYSGYGVYTVTLLATGYFGCNDTISKEILITDIPEILTAVDLKVRPNPSTGLFSLEFTVPLSGKRELIVYDFLGQIVLRKQLIVGQTNVDIDLRDFHNGMYFYRIDYQGEMFVGKLEKME